MDTINSIKQHNLIFCSPQGTGQDVAPVGCRDLTSRDGWFLVNLDDVEPTEEYSEHPENSYATGDSAERDSRNQDQDRQPSSNEEDQH